ncbi:MAG TPA: tRNA (adenosine(37)-N6)-dimethylallyltransferase MiaA [Candidatus Paceibacterota bacterium]
MQVQFLPGAFVGTKVIAVVGPTASGKSALAVRLARQFNGEMISADSRQVYRGLNIGSGKITKREMKGVPHYLLDVANPKRPSFTVAQYQKLAKLALENIIQRKKTPIVCGGTGFYINALRDNLILPPIAPNPKLRQQLDRLDDRQLYLKLKRLDPKRAGNIDPYNRRRLIRAIEITTMLGRVPSLVIKGNPSVKGSPWHWLMLGIKLSPEELRKKIDARLKFRINHGLIAEVRRLHRNGVSWKRLDELGLEYRYVAKFLRQQKHPLEMAFLERQLSTVIWHYAKRQMTWFKRDKTIQWVENYREAERLTMVFLRKSGKIIKIGKGL